MKIDGLDPSKNIQTPGSVKKTTGPAEGLFLDALKQAADNLTANAGGTQQVSKSGVGPISSSPFIFPGSGSLDQASMDMIGKLDSLFNDLSMFKNALGNTAIPLDRLAPLARELSSRKEEIADMLSNMSDAELKNVATDALKVAIEHINGYHAGYAA
jgi:hypothetical protein